MGNSKVFFGGVPTSIDIRKLQEQWPETEMKAGDTFPYEEIEIVISEGRSTNRFKTITNRWRNIVERNTGKRINPDGLNGFKVLTESEKLAAIEGKRRSIEKQGRRNLVRAGFVERKSLNNDERRRLDHVVLNEKNALAVKQLRQPLELPEM